MIKRYQDEYLSSIWNRTAEVERWFAVEVEHMRGIRDERAATRLQQIGRPDLDRIAQLELSTRHEIVAFLRALDERIQKICGNGVMAGELRQWLHYGLTSSDVVDTGLGLALKHSHNYLSELAELVVMALGHQVALLNDDPPVLSRTHGQWAVAMPAGHRWTVLWGMLIRALTEFRGNFRGIAVGKLSGPVGVSTDTQSWALSRLGLRTIAATQPVPRDGIARWANALAGLATVCEAIATQVWLLAQEDIDEIREASAPDQIGSSAMPHKRNPIASENICGLARLVRMYAGVLQVGVVQWGEHDLAHSSVERVALPDLCHVSATILMRTTVLLSGLESRSNPLPEGMNSHEILCQLQREGMPYVEAHEYVRSNSYPDGKIDGDNDLPKEA